MIGTLRRALDAARLLAQALLDVAHSTGGPPRECPRVRRSFAPDRLRRRLGALDRLRRIAERLGLDWSCRTSALALYRTMLREGARTRLCFGVRRERADDGSPGRYVGHAWTVAGDADDGELRSDYPLVVEYPGTGHSPAWRRG